MGVAPCGLQAGIEHSVKVIEDRLQVLEDSSTKEATANSAIRKRTEPPELIVELKTALALSQMKNDMAKLKNMLGLKIDGVELNNQVVTVNREHEMSRAAQHSTKSVPLDTLSRKKSSA